MKNSYRISVFFMLRARSNPEDHEDFVVLELEHSPQRHRERKVERFWIIILKSLCASVSLW